jgi:Transposase DDE domain
MTSVTQISRAMKRIMEKEANQIARDVGCVQRQRKFSGATLLQTLVFGFGQHPDATLEQLVSTAQIRQVQISDTGLQKRFTPACARFLHEILTRLSQIVVQAAAPVPIELVERFAMVVLEDSSLIALPDALQKVWQGCGGSDGVSQAAVKMHTRLDLKQGQLWGPTPTAGRQSDRRSPFKPLPLPQGSLYIADLGYFDLEAMARRQQAGSFTLTRLRGEVAVLQPSGRRVSLETVVPAHVGEIKELLVLVGEQQRLPMRLVMQRVPAAVAAERRRKLEQEANRWQRPVATQASRLADWTLLLTDAPITLLHPAEALVLVRERWQMELLYKLWKSDGLIDDWTTDNPWQVLCEMYAKLIASLLQHWCMVLFAWSNEQRSWHKLAQIVRDTMWTLMEAFAGERSMASVWRLIQRRMQAGCSMNTRASRPNSAQMLQSGHCWDFPP